nr:hypothetical protein [Alkalimarinus coralli]
MVAFMAGLAYFFVKDAKKRSKLHK